MAYLRFVKPDPDVEKLKEAITAHLSLKPVDGERAFESLYTKIRKHFHEDDDKEPDNGVANLVLLNRGTNRSYKNAVFAVKRQRVLDLDRRGVFVPHCTRNVFLKCYSPRVDHTMYWTREDREGYFGNLLETLYGFAIDPLDEQVAVEEQVNAR